MNLKPQGKRKLSKDVNKSFISLDSKLTQLFLNELVNFGMISIYSWEEQNAR